MARVTYTPSGADGPVGRFEALLLETLRLALPRAWALAPNFQLKQRGHDALEYDVVCLASHAVFVIEAKEWYGRLSGDDQEWLLNQTPRRCPMWTVNHKCKVLKTELGALASHAAQPWTPRTSCTAQTFAGAFMITWAQRGPTGQILGGWKLCHVVPYFC